MATVKVTMTETVTYEVEMGAEELAALLNEKPSPDLQQRLKRLTEESPSSDYGIEGAVRLLDLMLDAGQGVSVDVCDRGWSFEFPELVDLPNVKPVKYEPEW